MKGVVVMSYTERPKALALLRTALVLFVLLTIFLWTTSFALDSQDKGQPAEKSNSPAVAPLVLTGSLTLSHTLIQTENSLLGLSTTPASAFSPIAVSCPSSHTKGCTIAVIVSSQFYDITSGDVAQVNVSAGSLTVNPSNVVNVDSTSTGILANVHTFQWMIESAPAGVTQTVDISFDVDGGTASAGYRTATVQLFLN
jgi:hypothetical protein